jgi:flagellar motor switch protein FliN
MNDDLAKAMEEEMARAMGISPASSPGSEPKTVFETDATRRAMLLIRTPVTVTLARKRESLKRILDLVPGSMLTFETHCEELMTLEAGGHPIAKGETIKIGDKFGLRIREIVRHVSSD